ncbi:hypothetical protein KC960_04000 [Candidatus Saccharibacteria bacterium]|nr:hypothetical protein [Candidatus Saccharibacteria bacterium]
MASTIPYWPKKKRVLEAMKWRCHNQLPPAIDLEYVGNSKQRPSKEEFQTKLREFIDITIKEFGQDPMLYTTYNFYGDYLNPEFSSYEIWIRDIYSHPNTQR